ncbi:MAG: antibiotic biosynthesis monooxygenase family protein [Candidatus Acidiferrales bacterium]
MLYILWEYRVHKTRRRSFERHYSATGAWVRFFRKGRGYRGTILLRNREKPNRYFTIDRWVSLAEYRRFRRRHQKHYDALDKRFERLTEKETCLGYFETAGRTKRR